MISETSLIGADGLPDVMQGRFDKPWHFVGEMKHTPICVNLWCKKCSRSFNDFVRAHGPECDWSMQPMPYHKVTLDRYLFVTDDMLHVFVYFGVCDECDSVYWARQGPPFERVRSYVGV